MTAAIPPVAALAFEALAGRPGEVNPRAIVDRRVRQQVQRHQQQRADAEEHRDPLERPEGPGEHGRDDDPRREQHREHLRHAQVAGRQGDPDELGDDRQPV